MSDFLVSPLTAATLVVGVVIAIFYLRNMWLVLQRTAETLDEPEDKRPDSFAYSFVGAIVAVPVIFVHVRVHESTVGAGAIVVIIGCISAYIGGQLARK